MKKIMLLTLALGMMSFEIASADVTNYNIELRDGKFGKYYIRNYKWRIYV